MNVWQASNVMDHQPLLPSMSLDSFLNFVEEPGAQHADAPAKAAMLRQACTLGLRYDRLPAPLTGPHAVD